VSTPRRAVVRPVLFALVAATLLCGCAAAHNSRAADPINTPRYPQRVILTWNGNPATTQAINWHTKARIDQAYVEIAPADASPRFNRHARRVEARTQTVKKEKNSGYFHSTTFTGLDPNTLYAYRVGDGEVWSAWFHFRTARDEPAPFRFIYFGDAQNAILSYWARTFRQAYSDAPDADFLLHAGDLVNRANSRREWAEWFESAGWVNGMVPVIATPGNHEYWGWKDGPSLSRFWRSHFTFPEHGPEGLEESVYYIDYQGARIISLNSVVKVKRQARWLERVLKDNPNRWTFVTCHYPLFATKSGRDNKSQRKHWRPLFEKYGVDMVLQGHDHAYGRGHAPPAENLPVGARQRHGDDGPVYVVSVSGPKMYKADHDADWIERSAENTQLYQVIEVDGDTLSYRAMTATGELYDAFDLVKNKNGTNDLIDRLDPDAPRRTFDNTLQ